MARTSSAVVVGAGVAGACTALELRRRGLDVTLVDAWEPGHAAAASAGEHRILRSSHGTDELYTRWSREARLGWLELQEACGRELFVQAGAVLLARTGSTAWEDASKATLGRLGVPHFTCGPDELGVRLPVLRPDNVAYALWEPESGFVYAKRALLAVVEQLRREGGSIRRSRVTTDSAERPLLDGAPITADVVVMACGAWMGALFRRSLFRLLDVARQNVIMISPPPGDDRYDCSRFPAWIDHGYPRVRHTRRGRSRLQGGHHLAAPRHRPRARRSRR
jgi:N-methyl-L-tryptophan oxidase